MRGRLFLMFSLAGRPGSRYPTLTCGLHIDAAVADLETVEQGMAQNGDEWRTGPGPEADSADACPRMRAGAGRGKLRQGLLQTALLSRLAEGEAHGYSLIDSAASLIGMQACVDPGTVYRILRALEAEGCVASHWESPSSGPGRRVYAVTPAGLDLLRTWCAFLERRAEGLLAVARWGRSALGETPPAAARSAGAGGPFDQELHSEESS